MLLIISNVEAIEKRIKIGVVDTGVSYSLEKSTIPYLCENGRKSTIPNDYGFDNHGHGTNVISQIANKMNVKTHCIISYKVWERGLSGHDSIQYSIDALRMALRDRVSFLNVSMSGMKDNLIEFNLYKTAVKRGIIISVAAGNDMLNLDKKCEVFPACYRNIINENSFNVVGAYDVKTANRGKVVNRYETGKNVRCPRLKGIKTRGYRLTCPTLSGTSQATAIFTGKIIQK